MYLIDLFAVWCRELNLQFSCKIFFWGGDKKNETKISFFYVNFYFSATKF